MTFRITDHNLEYVLAAYHNKVQPKTLTVPYDRYGNEIEIAAPKREEIQDALRKYDIDSQIQRWHPGLAYADDGIEVTVYNDPDKKIRVENICRGLSVIHFDTEYGIKEQYDSKTGFNRYLLYNTATWKEPGIMRRGGVVVQFGEEKEQQKDLIVSPTISLKSAIQPKLRKKYR